MTDAAGWSLTGGGETGARLREHDWATSPLGPARMWPAALRNALNLMLNSPENLYLVWGPELTFFFNDAYRPILGPRLDGALGASLPVLWADAWEAVRPSIEQALAGRSCRFADVPIGMTRYGEPEETWWSYSFSPVYDDAGRAGGVLCHSRETTARVRGALDLRASEARLRALNADLERQVVERALERGQTWQVSPDLLSVLDLDTGVVDRVNPAWTAALGWAAAEIEGRPYADFVHPGDLSASSAAFAQVRHGEPVLNFENRYRHRDGSHRALSWVAVPEGAKVYSRARDVTAEKAQAETLRRSETRAAAYFDFSEDYLFLVRVGSDGVARFEDMNPACERVMGLVRAQVVGQAVESALPPDSAGDIAAYARLCLESRRSQTYQAPRTYREGAREVVIDGRVAFVERDDDDGGLVLFSGHDVTDQRAVEDALRQSQKMEAVGQLTGGVAHDFNNLLTVIKSSTDLLKRPDLTPERLARYVAAISDTVDRAAKLTGQLLAFARRQALKPEVFAACDSVRALSDMVGTLTGSQVTIGTDLSERACFVNADPSQFDTALVNMAVNARDAMGGTGRLTIGVRPVEVMPALRVHPAVDGPFVAVSIADTGGGIAPDVLERIFEPFFTTKAVGQGTGLGLSQVFGFAKQSGGDVHVTSTLGEGTTFTLYLPRVAAPEQPAAADDPAPLADGHGTRVLVVENNTEVGTFTVQGLTDLGYVTVLATDGPSALAELARDAARFDVVFSDVVMPGMSGIELGQEVRRLYRDLPLVLTSGYSHVLAQNGSYGFGLLHKPYSVEQLSQMLRKAVTRHRRGSLPGP